MKPRLTMMIRAAREVNPMNDWLLARMVAVQVMTACAIFIAIKL